MAQETSVVLVKFIKEMKVKLSRPFGTEPIEFGIFPALKRPGYFQSSLRDCD